ncbi:MAG: hypothetical protein V7K92_10110 [Nostoc sp.]|uniref:endonuclease/exonuclease/phosphatase family protein n=1 Tax=Nostoc sp. TaxID=1180 RepID=UPI002FF380F7
MGVRSVFHAIENRYSPLLSLSGKAIARRLIRQLIQAILLEKINDQKLFIIANHFISKLGGSPSDAQRVKQAQIVNEFVAQLLQVDPQANVIVLGDLNDLPDSLPLKTLEGNILENLTVRLPLSDQFSFKFRGNPELIDHLLDARIRLA